MNEEILSKYKIFLAVNHRKNQTVTTYYYPVKRFLEWIGNRPINQDNLNVWLMYQNTNGFRQNGIVTRIVAINKFLKWIGKTELKIKKPPWAKTYRRTISFDEIQQMIRTAEQMGAKYELALRFITDLDCRNNEICNAKWSNIVGDRIYFDDTKTGDNFGFITPSLRNALERYKEEKIIAKKGYEDYILIGDRSNNKGKRYSVRGKSINYIIKKIAFHSDIGRKVNPYDLRASVITEEFNHYVNPRTIQRKARHKNQLTTQRYNHVDDEMVREYVNYNLIFDKPSLQAKKRKQSPINFNLSKTDLSQGIYKPLENEDNTSFSFSISFYQTFFASQRDWGFCDIKIWDIKPPLLSTDFRHDPQSLISSQEVMV